MVQNDSFERIARLRIRILLTGLLMLASIGTVRAQGEGKHSSVDSSKVETVPLDVNAAGTSIRGGRALEAAPASSPLPVSAKGISNWNTSAAAPQMLSAPGVSSTLGATVGGAQDIGYARKTIESGEVPRFIDFSPEGLYSEHDIPTPASECNAKLCLSLGYGFAPTADDSSNSLFIHLGLNSNIKADEFKRSALQLAVVVDKSGSMEGSSMNSVKQALASLVGKLTSEDELTIVEFADTARLLLPPTRVKDREAILRAIGLLKADGGTNIEAGLNMGFAGLASLPSRPNVSRRLMLFTDAIPNVGRTDSSSFRTLTARYADQGIGLTAFGVGLNFGHDVVYHITQLRGGNFFFLETPEKIAKVFDHEFDYLVTPLVYDLKVRIRTPSGLKLKDVYGLPGWKPGDRDAELDVPTVFLSSNRGAIVLRYERENGEELRLPPGSLLASGRLSYTDVDGRTEEQEEELRHSGSVRMEPGVQYYTHDGMRLVTALTNVYFGLRDGCRLYTEGRTQDAENAVNRAKTLAELENMRLSDAGLADEIALLGKLAENIEKQSAVHRNVDTDQGVPRYMR